MRHMGSLNEAESMLTGIENLTVIHALRRTKREVVDAHQCADHAAHGLSCGSHLKPFVERATLVRLEVTEGNPTDCRRIDDRRNCLAHCRKQRIHSGVK